MTVAAVSVFLLLPRSTKTPVTIEPITTLQLKEMLAKKENPITIVNLWATFCGPCVAEIPDFLRYFRENKSKGVDLILISSDFKKDLSAAQEFLKKQKVDFVSYIKNENDEAFISGVHKDWTGALPATLIFGPQGKLLHFASQPLNYLELEKLIAGAGGLK